MYLSVIRYKLFLEHIIDNKFTYVLMIHKKSKKKTSFLYLLKLVNCYSMKCDN